ncbi:MAG: hypothetical protein NVSMB29_01550 [Candidatus Dormibacteria bacterium]
MSGRFRPLAAGAPWPTVLGGIVSITAVVLGLRFGIAGLAGTIAIGLFALFVSAAIVSSRRTREADRAGLPAASADGRAAERRARRGPPAA